MRLTKGEGIPLTRLFNVSDSIAFDCFPGPRWYQEQFWQVGAASVNLAGSGPVLFTLVEDKILAEKMCDNLQRHGLESYLTETLGAIEPLS